VDGSYTDASAILDGFTITAGNANTLNIWPTSNGSGMLNSYSYCIIKNCIFRENSSEHGGAMFNYNSGMQISNCIFFRNSSKYDGGVMINDSSNLVLVNCTFASNKAGNRGGSIYNSGSNQTITNCILWGNTARTGSQIYNYNSNTNITYSNVQGGFSGTGNIYLNPLFMGAGDFRLQSGSPCIDAGNNSAVPTGVTTDLAGNPRFIDDPCTSDTGAGTPPIVDMGAFEYIRPQHSITASAGSNGVINPNGTFVKNYGDNQQFEAIPETGYVVDKWYRDGNLAQTGGLIYTLNNIQADAIVLVNFKPTVVLTMSVSPSEAGITVPAIGTNEVAKNEAIPISAQSNAGYVFNGWTASPAENVIFGNSNSSSTTVTLSDNATVTANFLPPVDLTMAVQPSEGGTTTPSVGTSPVEHGLAKPIEAHANADYGFISWTAIPAENVVFGNANAPSTTAALSSNAIVTANFNAKPVADIKATVNVLVITDANSVTLDANGSTDDGLPNPPGIMTYHWEKVSGPNTCSILEPNEAVTEVMFWGLGSYQFSVTVSDGQLQDVKSATVDVIVEVAYVANDGDDNAGLGTIENPFATIQKGINTVQDNGTVIVLPGTYYENINFGGKKVTVRSNNPNDANVVANSVINANGSGSVVVFDSGEDANSVLAGFTITGGNAELGGGIYINEASPVVERNVIRGNRAGSEGGGIYCQGGSATIRYNEISNNYSNFVGGVSFENSFAVLQNNLIVNNNAEYDSGVACIEGQPRIVNNTITGNVAVYDYDSSGLIIMSSLLPAIISNNIIAFNYGATGVVDFYGFDPNYFSYNDVYGHPDGNYLSAVLPEMDQTGVNGNISVNPLFADTDANNYHLLPASLLIDAGDPSSDWSNEPRPNGGRINMGAYGNTPEASCSVAGDITWDKKVDFKDFAKLAFYWLQNEPSVDIAPLVSGDNIVDVGDLAVLAENWLEGI
jgi:hypothetical protein